MVLRLIPALSRKEKQIANARALIGKSPGESDSIKEKIKNGTGKRTNFNIYHMNAHDWILAVIMISLLLGVVFLEAQR